MRSIQLFLKLAIFILIYMLSSRKYNFFSLDEISLVLCQLGLIILLITFVKWGDSKSKAIDKDNFHLRLPIIIVASITVILTQIADFQTPNVLLLPRIIFYIFSVCILAFLWQNQNKRESDE